MRTSTWSLNAAALAALSLAGAGCTLNVDSHRDRDYDDRRVVVERRHYDYDREHVVVVEQPPADAVVVATEAPPPEYTEVIPPAPGPDFVWIGGNWVISGGRWVWVRGHYDRPPHRGAHWEAHTWVHVGDHFEFRAGHWR